MEMHYNSEKNVQMLIALMKANGIKKVIASPGTTNIAFVASIQFDSWFEIYSSADERSAAYMACGLAAETGEPVALSCTGATASRNYIPGLTEAYYRKLPVLAITSTQHPGRIGSNRQQVIDRTVPLRDITVCDVQANIPRTEEDQWALNVSLNKAMIALRKNGGGPVHIDLMTEYSRDFNVRELPTFRAIQFVSYRDCFPKLKKGRIGIYVGNHEKWDEYLTKAVDKFCELYDGIVICDHTSNYKGRYRIDSSLVCSQRQYCSPLLKATVMIYIGYVNAEITRLQAAEVWRVNADGEIRDNSHATTFVFQMEEVDFFDYYVHYAEMKGIKEHSREDFYELFIEDKINNTNSFYRVENTEEVSTCSKDESNEIKEDNAYFKENNTQDTYYEQWKSECTRIAAKIPELPFSNPWIAQNTASKLPNGSVLHLGILNSLRCWNYFKVTDDVYCYANTGGFGIDGDISSLVGASLSNSQKLFFGVFGDLAFFYDMNVLGNRHFGKNVRIMLINNGRGTEFRNYGHPAAGFGEDADPYMAAAGHYGNKSTQLVKHYATDLGFEYMSASSKDEYLSILPRFLASKITDRPMLCEVFTDSVDESNALEILYNLETSKTALAKGFVKKVLGEKGVATIKNIMKR